MLIKYNINEKDLFIVIRFCEDSTLHLYLYTVYSMFVF